MISLRSKEQGLDLRRSELNLMHELKIYRRSGEMSRPNMTSDKRKTKSL